jgi:hypothetical protein
MKNMNLAAAVCAMVFTTGVAWTRDDVPPDPGGPTLLEPCYQYDTKKDIPMCEKCYGIKGTMETIQKPPVPCPSGDQYCEIQCNGNDTFREIKSAKHGMQSDNVVQHARCHIIYYKCDGQDCVRSSEKDQTLTYPFLEHACVTAPTESD